MGSTPFAAIKRVIAAFERSDWAEIDVRAGDVRVHLATRPPAHGGDHAAEADPSATADGADGAPADEWSADTGTPTPRLPPPDGTHLVVSPSPGIFWRSPEPGAPPFADVGESILSSTTVCIVEVMKLMNHVKAGVDGEVVAVYGHNGVAVRKGEPLFAIAPTGSTR